VSLVQGQTVASAERVIEQRVADDVLAMLKTVSQEGGTAAKAAIPAYSFAGKTGTVHKVGAHGYEAKRYQSLFAGMAPADAPRVVGVVVVNDPRGGKYFGGEVAAPVFSRVAGDALRLLGVAPDKLEDFTGQELLAVGVEIDSAKRG
jgi:cell division protein FtsI (penicillin-binding protein 3)